MLDIQQIISVVNITAINLFIFKQKLEVLSTE